MLYHNQTFLGKNKKFAPKWLGPATIVKINKTNVRIKCKSGKSGKSGTKLNVSHIKIFKIINSEHYEAEQDEFEFQDPEQNPNPPNN